MIVQFTIDCPMKQVSDFEYMGRTHIGYSDELVTFKYNLRKKRGYIKNGSQWKWIKPQMAPVTVGTITVKQGLARSSSLHHNSRNGGDSESGISYYK